MNLLNSLRNLLRPAPPPSKLRNKPGGLARVRMPCNRNDGTYAMHGCFVTTVRLDGDGFWILDPPLQFTTRVHALANGGRIAFPGDVVTVESMHDDLLEPIRDVGDWERDESLNYLPPVPQDATAPKGVPA